MAEHNLLGKKGEELAKQFLVREGYKIIDTNWRFKKTEIDIVALKDDRVVIVEVKTRSNQYFELPQEAVTIKKQRNIVKTADEYICQHNIDLEARFDIVSVIFVNNKHEIEHIKDAFQASLLL